MYVRPFKVSHSSLTFFLLKKICFFSLFVLFWLISIAVSRINYMFLV